MSKLKLTIILWLLLGLSSCNTEIKEETKNENTSKTNNEGKAEEINISEEIASLDEKTLMEEKDEEITSDEWDSKTYTGYYTIPDWEEQVSFDVSFGEDGEIESVMASSTSLNHVTVGYITKFNNGTAKHVVWKKVEDIPMDAVNWASLITETFIKTIKEDV